MDQIDHSVANRPSIQDILKPLIYADIFDYPLTVEEIHKYLDVKAGRETVHRLLQQALENRKIVMADGYYSLATAPHLAALRHERQQYARTLWPQALRYGRWIASLPFIQMVAVTGSLAVDNPRHPGDDIDYLIVTQKNRLWLCRALIIQLVRFGLRRGVHLCPNYLLTENVLHFDEDSLYTARELRQMVPLYGSDVYHTLRQLNSWTHTYLPNDHQPDLDRLDDRLTWFQTLVKKTGRLLFAGPIGNLTEKILQKIQIDKHTRRARRNQAQDRVRFTPDVCKGHYDGHGGKTMAAYQQRLQHHTSAEKKPHNGRYRP